MKRIAFITSIFFVFIVSTAFLGDVEVSTLRQLYEKPISEWPKPTIDEGIKWEEFKSLPVIDTSYFSKMKQPKVNLGKLLFFDPRLSGSNQISCSSCHDPQLSFGDGKSVALGHNHTLGNRNTPSLLNVYARKSLFWDGRAASLEEQASSPIEAHHEMAMDPHKLPKKLKGIKGYQTLFTEAFGDDKINMERITIALAEFQRTLQSRRSRFDLFLDGKYSALTDKEIEGMHIFRTKARCMNCHNGQFFTDEDFHNIGLTYYKRKYQDLGRYEVTKDPNDAGKFKTPSLRDVMHNGPWMHNGLFSDIMGVVNIYNSGMHMIDPTDEQKKADPMYPYTDRLLKPLKLTTEEKRSLVAFLEAITATQYKMPRPELPK